MTSMAADDGSATSTPVGAPPSWGLWLAVAVLGTETLMVYNALLSSAEFFEETYSGLLFPFTSMIAYSGPMCITQTYMVFKGQTYSLKRCMRFSFAGIFLSCCALVGLVVLSADMKILAYSLTLISIAVLAVTSAVMQSGLMGFAGPVSESLTAAAMFGMGICGLMTFGVSEALIFSGMDRQTQTIILFTFCLVCTLVAYWVCERFLLPEAQARTQLFDNPQMLLAMASPRMMRPNSSSSMEPKDVLRIIRPQAINVCLVFVSTLGLFPGVITKWQWASYSKLGNQQALTTLLVGLFQLFDVIGRYSAGPVARLIPPGCLVWVVLLRFSFVPLFILGQRSPGDSWLWGSDLGRGLLMAVFAASNGFLGSCAMMFGPEHPELSKGGKSVAGNAMSCFMVWGIFVGCLLAPLTQIGI